MDEHRVTVMFRNWLNGSRDFYTTTSNDRGTTFSPAHKVGEGTWKLSGCPMDGGAIDFDANGAILTVWRREKTVFTAKENELELPLAESASQPILAASKDRIHYLWENNGNLILKSGESADQLFAEKGAAASIAALPSGGAIVVWESNLNDHHKLLARKID